MNYWTQNHENNIYVAGHRGLPARFPENTMPSFIAAAEAGIDQIETDVRITKDGELVTIHDATVDRTTNGSGRVCDFTLAELKKLDAGSWKGAEFAGAQIPTFIEFMDCMKKYDVKTLDIELKEYPVEGWEEISYSVCDRVLQILDDYGYTDRVVLNTFSGKLHEYIREKYGNKYRQHVYWPQHYLGEGYRLDPYSYAYCCCMFGDEQAETAPKADFEYMRQRGIQPWAGAACKNASDVDNAIAKGADLITANNPDEILRILREKGYHE